MRCGSAAPFAIAARWRNELFKLVAAYGGKTRKFSDEYDKVVNYYSLANYPTNNSTVRKVL